MRAAYGRRAVSDVWKNLGEKQDREDKCYCTLTVLTFVSYGIMCVLLYLITSSCDERESVIYFR